MFYIFCNTLTSDYMLDDAYSTQEEAITEASKYQKAENEFKLDGVYNPGLAEYVVIDGAGETVWSGVDTSCNPSKFNPS